MNHFLKDAVELYVAEISKFAALEIQKLKYSTQYIYTENDMAYLVQEQYTPAQFTSYCSWN